MPFPIKSVGAALLLGAMLSGCGSFEMLFVNPASFDYMSCANLAGAAKSTAKRQQDLKELIDRAEQDSVGVFIAATTYRTEYVKTQGDLKLIADAAQSKKCDTPTP
jgi:hypothetical protein